MIISLVIDEGIFTKKKNTPNLLKVWREPVMRVRIFLSFGFLIFCSYKDTKNALKTQ